MNRAPLAFPAGLHQREEKRAVRPGLTRVRKTRFHRHDLARPEVERPIADA